MVKSTKLATLDLIPKGMRNEFKTLEKMIQGKGRGRKELAAFLGTDDINLWVEQVSKLVAEVVLLLLVTKEVYRKLSLMELY